MSSSKFDDKMFDRLSRIACEGTHPRTFISAAIVVKNTVVSYGNNQMKTHPFQVKYGRNPESIFLHAEVAAIKNALRTHSVEELEGASIYICRKKYSASDKRKMIDGLAKPCLGCQRCAIEFGIKRIVFTTDIQGVYEEM